MVGYGTTRRLAFQRLLCFRSFFNFKVNGMLKVKHADVAWVIAECCSKTLPLNKRSLLCFRCSQYTAPGFTFCKR